MQGFAKYTTQALYAVPSGQYAVQELLDEELVGHWMMVHPQAPSVFCLQTGPAVDPSGQTQFGMPMAGKH